MAPQDFRRGNRNPHLRANLLLSGTTRTGRNDLRRIAIRDQNEWGSEKPRRFGRLMRERRIGTRGIPSMCKPIDNLPRLVGNPLQVRAHTLRRSAGGNSARFCYFGPRFEVARLLRSLSPGIDIVLCYRGLEIKARRHSRQCIPTA